MSDSEDLFLFSIRRLIIGSSEYEYDSLIGRTPLLEYKHQCNFRMNWDPYFYLPIIFIHWFNVYSLQSTVIEDSVSLWPIALKWGHAWTVVSDVVVTQWLCLIINGLRFRSYMWIIVWMKFRFFPLVIFEIDPWNMQ